MGSSITIEIPGLEGTANGDFAIAMLTLIVIAFFLIRRSRQ
jgi:hypothetical protein